MADSNEADITADQSLSVLNNNVDFDGTMDESMTSTKLSISLSDAERRKLQQDVTVTGTTFCTTKEDANKHQSTLQEETANQTTHFNESIASCSAAETTFDESSTVIDVDDSIDVAPQLMDDSEMADVTTEIRQSPIRTFDEELIELGRRCWPSNAEKQNYCKGCFWSPDGTCLLVPVNMDGMHVIDLPLDLYTATEVDNNRKLSGLQSAVHVAEGGTVYDCAWYPLMNSQLPETCFWLATRQHEPIHMWDAFDGSIRCTYSGYDEVDEVVAAISLAFSFDGQKIYAGYKKCIKIFDTNRPGRVYDEYSVKKAISCIAQTTDNSQTVTCGNWSGYIQHFDLRSSPKDGPLFTLGGHSGGITQLRYRNTNEWQLFSGARKCSKLLVWDMRNYKKPLREFTRNVKTNQRIHFDLSESWLMSGDTEGLLRLWDLDNEQPPVAEQEADAESIELQLHGDCCNGVSFHPTMPIIASSSGQFHFLDSINSMSDSICDETAASSCTLTEEAVLTEEPQPDKVVYENAVLLLWHGKHHVTAA